MDVDDDFERFLRTYWDHRDHDTIEPLSFYVAKYPQAAERIAIEYASLGGLPSGSRSDRRLGPFLLRSEIGRGGQGVVYLAEDTRLKRQVALKVMPADVHPSAEQIARFERESRLASRLEHPAICPIYEAGFAEGMAYIAMRWIEGRSLADHLSDATERFPEHRYGLTHVFPGSANAGDNKSDHDRLSRILDLVEQVARGLHAAHVSGVVHRDLKPANVMIDGSGAPVLLDFGMSKDISSTAHSLTESGAVFGTPSYMSPEQVIGDHRHMTPATDIYALGVLLFECLTLQRPFERETQAATLLAIRQSAPERLRRIAPHIPKDVETIIETALSKLVGQRFESAEVFANELRRIRDREPIRTKTLRSWTRTWRWAQRNPRLAAALGGLIAALTTGLAVALVLLADVRTQAREAERVADVTYLQRLRSTGAEDLLTIDPALTERFGAWLTDAKALLDRRRVHVEARGKADAQSQPDGSLAEWQGQMSVRFLSDLDAFADPKSEDLGSYHRVLDRADLARTLRVRSIEEHSKSWATAIREIADTGLYGGLEISEQLGLVPLGPDPTSSLAEFAVFGTGVIPGRDRNGRLALDEGSAIVLVLLPGGLATLGLPATDPFSRGDDVAHAVALDPFFLGKFEVSQAQWERWMHSQPSHPDDPDEPARHRPGPVHPVNQVSWAASDRFCRTLLLQLPTEAQWEYAFSCGSRADSTPQPGNYADRASAAAFREDWESDPGDDSWSLTAPCGSYPANPWGLHDLGGNVEEWVADWFISYSETPPEAGSGLRRQRSPRAYRCTRGGSFEKRRPNREAAKRAGDKPESEYWARGFRVARTLER